jgi:hypothetical protein
MSDDSTAKTERIRALNDRFRQTMTGGRFMMTAGVSALGAERVARLVQSVRAFNTFSADNDPHGEHDFGAIDDNGERFFWKIDYYDLSMEFHSEDAADASKTVRVLTVMLAGDL